MNFYLNLPAPAKLNLFLHVTGRRPDGMHLLESVFTLIDLCDYIDIQSLPNSQIERLGDISWPIEKDLCWRAAKLLQKFAPNKGCRISVIKNIPNGAGLGGGSSDAATCLIGLNKLWNLNFSREELMALGLQLGADVPFFVFGQAAFASGVGEVLTPVAINPFKARLIYPGVSVATRDVFTSADLTRNTKPVRMEDFSGLADSFPGVLFGRNDLEPVTRKLSPEVEAVFRLLGPTENPRMTGSGSAVFSAVQLGDDVQEIKHLPPGWTQWVVKSLKIHPLFAWLEP